MTMDLNIRIYGEAGQGVQTTGMTLAKAFASLGYHVFSTQSYLSRIRGGENSFDIRVSDAELFSSRALADLAVTLSDNLLEASRAGITEKGLIVFDGEAENAICVNLKKIATEAGGAEKMGNSVAAGIVFGILGLDSSSLEEQVVSLFGAKSEEIKENNKKCARKGVEVGASLERLLTMPESSGAPHEVMSGADAFALGSATAGVRLACSYPMSPSTEVFAQLAALSDKYRIVVEQAEDEISAINMICGAAYAGVPAITTTSGGGFALMTEGVSLAGMMELPIVVLVAQRPGPATGLPTRTGQEDLRFAIHAGHGEFPKIVLAPGSIPQAFALTRRAFELAHKFQTPVILLADAFMIEQMKNHGADISNEFNPIDRNIVSEPSADYVRYEVTESGVSPRALPGGEGYVVSDSDEHDEAGHITENLDTREIMQDKRMRKLDGIKSEFVEPEIYPAMEEEAILCWGSSYGPCREAVDVLRAQGRKICIIHFSQVWPLDPSRLVDIFKNKKIICVEGNYSAQFAGVLKEMQVLSSCETILKYNGLPFTGEEIVERFKS